MNPKSAYDILGLAPDSSDEQIRQSYLDLVKKYHPDAGKRGASAFSQKRFQILNQAYDQIKTPARRAAYDATLKAKDYKRKKSYFKDLKPGNDNLNQNGYTGIKAFWAWFFRPLTHDRQQAD